MVRDMRLSIHSIFVLLILSTSTLSGHSQTTFAPQGGFSGAGNWGDARTLNGTGVRGPATGLNGTGIQKRAKKLNGTGIREPARGLNGTGIRAGAKILKGIDTWKPDNTIKVIGNLGGTDTLNDVGALGAISTVNEPDVSISIGNFDLHSNYTNEISKNVFGSTLNYNIGLEERFTSKRYSVEFNRKNPNFVISQQDNELYQNDLVSLKAGKLSDVIEKEDQVTIYFPPNKNLSAARLKQTLEILGVEKGDIEILRKDKTGEETVSVNLNPNNTEALSKLPNLIVGGSSIENIYGTVVYSVYSKIEKLFKFEFGYYFLNDSGRCDGSTKKKLGGHFGINRHNIVQNSFCLYQFPTLKLPGEGHKIRFNLTVQIGPEGELLARTEHNKYEVIKVVLDNIQYQHGNKKTWNTITNTDKKRYKEEALEWMGDVHRVFSEIAEHNNWELR